VPEQLIPHDEEITSSPNSSLHDHKQSE
jgi:hypothetical protein